MFGGLDGIDIERDGGIYVYIRMYVYILWFFLFKTSNPLQWERRALYIGNGLSSKLLQEAKAKGQRVQGLFEKLGQLVGFLRKPRQGVKASSRSHDQRVQKKGGKVSK